MGANTNLQEEDLFMVEPPAFSECGLETSFFRRWLDAPLIVRNKTPRRSVFGVHNVHDGKPFA